jgi:hypothetical protein
MGVDMSKYTQGPWKLLEGPIPYPVITDGNGKNIVNVCGNDMGASLSREENEANARLIAAAPDMLRMLKRLCQLDWAKVGPIGTMHRGCIRRYQ